MAALSFSALLLVLGNSGTIAWFPPPVVFSLVGISLLASLIYPFIWQLRERSGKADPEKLYGFLYACIRYCVAFNIASFGWKKIFGLQFNVPPSISAIPMNQQSGEWLTWYYYGYSHAFGVIVAVMQIGGSCLLLFRRTLLLASMVLLPVMLNIALINIFYNMNAGALLQSVVITLALVFLLLKERKKLVVFFLQTASSLPSMHIKNIPLKTVLRLSAIVLSLLFTIYLKQRM